MVGELAKRTNAKISQFTVQELLSQSEAKRWAAAVGAHQGRVKGERVQVREPWEEERRRLAAEVIEVFGTLPVAPSTDAALWFLAGLITVADWIGSDERNFPQDAIRPLPERRVHARAALSAINWSQLQPRPQLTFSNYFSEIARPNSLQPQLCR